MPLGVKSCEKCGAPLQVGLAQCQNCGASVETVFSEQNPSIPKHFERRRHAPTDAEPYVLIEKARGRANNAAILGIASFFFPVIGLIMGPAAIYLGAGARKVLREGRVQEGQGAATAGMVIGAMSILAQISYVIYIWNSGLSQIIGK